MEQSKYSTIRVDVDGDTTTIIFNRPEVRNAINSKMVREITEAVRSADTLFLVFRGEGNVFSAGADAEYMRKIARMGYDDNLRDARRLATLFEVISSSSCITISVVHGASLGGGNGIVAASDLSVAAKNTLFSFSEVRLGLIPATISPYILSRIGKGKTLELFLTARQLDALEAHQIGLVTKVCDVDTLNDELEALKEHLRQNSPTAMRSVKRLIVGLENGSLDVKEMTSAFIADARSSMDGQEGLAAFLEKRKPIWFNAETQDKGW